MILRIIHVKIYTFLVHILIYSVTFLPGNGAFMLETRQYYYLYILLSTIIPVMHQLLKKLAEVEQN